MRVLGFQKVWPKLKQNTFTTFRYSRGDWDWEVGELVQIVIKPRSKERVRCGIAQIINKKVREFDEEYLKLSPEDKTPLVTDAEAIVDGFESLQDMIEWLRKTYGRLDWVPRMNKLTLRWVSQK